MVPEAVRCATHGCDLAIAGLAGSARSRANGKSSTKYRHAIARETPNIVAMSLVFMCFSRMLRGFAASPSWTLPGTATLAPVGGYRNETGAGALDHRVALKLREDRHRLAHRAIGVKGLSSVRKPRSHATSDRRRSACAEYCAKPRRDATLRPFDVVVVASQN